MPESRVWFVVAFLLAASLGVYAFVETNELAQAIPPIGAIVIGLFLPFTIAVSSQSVAANRVIAVGDTIPSFSAIDGSNNAFDSSSRISFSLLAAHWDPLCRRVTSTKLKQSLISAQVVLTVT